MSQYYPESLINITLKCIIFPKNGKNIFSWIKIVPFIGRRGTITPLAREALYSNFR